MELPPAMRARERPRSRRWGCGVARAAASGAAADGVASLAVIGAERVGRRAKPRRTAAEYVSRLESICKPGVEATQRAVRGVRSTSRPNASPSRRASSAAPTRIFDGTVSRISAVPRPPPTERSSPSGSRYLRLQESYLGRAAAALRAERIVQLPAQRRALRPHRQSRQRRGDRLRLQLLQLQVLALQLRCRESAVFTIAVEGQFYLNSPLTAVLAQD